jgi:hypothetical protein
MTITDIRRGILRQISQASAASSLSHAVAAALRGSDHGMSWRSFPTALKDVRASFGQGPVSERLHARLRNRENLFLTALIIIYLTPIWAFKYFPSQDGPAHINNANIIREYHERALFREYYVLNKDPVPNWFGHLVLAGLMYFMPALVAEKVLLSGYVILLPISVRYVLCAIRPDAGFLTVLTFPFVYNFLLHMGFYNFAYSLAMFFEV